MLNDLRIGTKLGLMMLVPLLAVIAMVAIVWQDGAAEIADAKDDRQIAAAVAVTSIVPRHLLSEMLVYDLSASGPADSRGLGRFCSSDPDFVDTSADRWRELPADAVPAEIRDALEAEILALEDTRAKSAAATLTEREITEQTDRIREINAAVLAWLGSQDVLDPNGSWRLLVVTAPSNSTLLDAATLAYRALVVGTLTSGEAQFMEDTLASFLSLSSLQDSLLPEDLTGSQRSVEETRTGVTELIGRRWRSKGRRHLRRSPNSSCCVRIGWD